MVSRAYFFHFCGSKIAILKLWSSVPVDLILFDFLKMLIFESNDFKKIENFGPSFISSIISHSSFLSPQSSSYISHSPLPTPHSPVPIPHCPHSSLSPFLIVPIPHCPHSTFSPLLVIHYPVPDPHSRF